MIESMLSFIGVAAGVLLLILGGGLLVRGASEVAAGFGVSPLIIGLTIVGFGTSSPELFINVIGALNGATGLAFGNVVGSNISNMGLVLGLAAVIAPIAIQGAIVRRELPLLLLATTMTTVMVLDGPLESTEATIGRIDSIILILTFCIFVYIVALDIVRLRREDRLLDEIREEPLVGVAGRSRYCWYFIAAGFLLLFVGGELTIRSGTALATYFGISPTVIGLFVVAIGTSMPELVTSIIAATKGESDLALGNVVGSNIFNSLMVMPASGVITQINLPPAGVGDLIISWLFAAALIPLFFFGNAKLGRISGAIFVMVYLAYAVFRIGGA